ncbi:Serine/threonine-protein kinase phg2 [Phytophthora citrophthora]|uniref:Serine/threonine-protein kinase phg2 n=1 Tax=Phytophthora citrophthora TaxID=4793 RepID=A0AAD9GSW2_9STRA|nr:Serine/threonine-protein kinase phg2 [Phytophthora citrophthora]
MLLLCVAVDVGETEGSGASSCPNVTTVSVYGSSSNSSKASTSSSNRVQVTDASCTSSVVKVTATAGVSTLDLRHRDIAAVSSLPAVDTVRLDNNELRAFTASNNISELYLSNNSIPTIDEFKFPTTLTLLDLSNNALGDLDGASLPPSLQYLDVNDASVASLEKFSFPSSIKTLNFSGNPITTIKGVIFPDSLTDFTLIATSNLVTAATASVITPDEARKLQTTVENAKAQTVSVLKEFEVRQSDAERFETLTLWDVSTTSTLSCSDSNAKPRYVQDTMLCVLSDSEFASKYESVVIAATSGSMSSSKWGTEASSSQEAERIALKETMDQRRSWFLIGAAALLAAFTALLFINGLCLCLGRKVRRVSKGKVEKPTLARAGTSRLNNFWKESASMEQDDEVHQLLSTTDGDSSQPEPEIEERDARDPIIRLRQELPRWEMDGALLTSRELLSTTTLGQSDTEGNGESSSPFIYFKAAFHRKPVVLKSRSVSEDNGSLAELWGFVEEIRLSSTLSHPQIVVFYGFVQMTRVTEQIEVEGVALVMEYMDKGDLNSFIQHHKHNLHDSQANDEDLLQSEIELSSDAERWSWRRSSAVYKSKLSIAIEVVQALQYLHSFSQPLFHGNLSSRKVFLDSDWNMKLGDLTCCSALRRWSSSHKHTEAPSTGSARFSGRSNCSSQQGEEIPMDMTIWTAPEVLDGRQYTQKADIYSFGVLLSQLATYECSSPEHSVMDDTEVPMLNNNDKDNSTGDSDAPTPIRLLIFRCQAFQPEVRPTADELLQELHQIENELMEKT